MARVAIVGSCITRDLWPREGPELEGLLYISRTSLPSLLAPSPQPRPEFIRKADALGPYQARAAYADLAKSALPQLIAHRPSHIIFDFIDERFDLLRWRGTVITASWELETAGYLEAPPTSPAARIPRLSSGCDRLWMQALRQWTALLETTPLRDAQVILHQAQWAQSYRDAGGALCSLGDAQPELRDRTAAHNTLLRDYQNAFLRQIPRAASVAAPQHRIAQEGHRWGLSPFHYVPEYYQEIWGQLRALGI